jgi:membrane protease subunit HflC
MTNRQRTILIAIPVGVLVLIVLARAVLFTVDERELAVVLQFGQPVASYTEPGLKFKLPFIQEVRKLPKSFQFWSGTGTEVLEDLPTADGKRIEVSAWAVWKISDPKQFVQVLRTVDNAQLRVATFVRGETRDVITSNDLVEVVRSSDRDLNYPVLNELLKILQEAAVEEAGVEKEKPDKPSPDQPPAEGEPAASDAGPGLEEWVLAQTATKERIRVGREKIVEQIKRNVQQALAETTGSEAGGRGIELVDMGISRIDFVDRVRDAAFDRQIARWESIASFYRSQGEKQRRQILNRTAARVEEIMGQGKQESNELRGDVEARIIDAYATAINETGEFYNFIRTLEAYDKALGPNTRLILTTDSEMLKLLKRVDRAGTPTTAPAAEP